MPTIYRQNTIYIKKGTVKVQGVSIKTGSHALQNQDRNLITLIRPSVLIHRNPISKDLTQKHAFSLPKTKRNKTLKSVRTNANAAHAS